MGGARGQRRTLRVLTHPAPSVRVSYSSARLIAEHLDADITALDFSWPLALFGRYDILHIHWPDHLVRAHRGPRRWVRPLLAHVLARHLKRRGTPLVWTVHNLTPHEPLEPDQQRAADVLTGAASARVFLTTAHGPMPPHAHDTVIPLGSAPHAPQPEPVDRAGILQFGRVQSYKGIEALLDAYARLPEDARPRLTVCGAPASADYAAEIEARSRTISGVDLDLQWQRPDVLERRVASAALVVLPYLHVYNSGAALTALSGGCPILVSASPTMRELRDEVGGDWVMLCEALTPETLIDALERARATVHGAPPNLDRRRWDAIGSQYSALYRRVHRAT